VHTRHMPEGNQTTDQTINDLSVREQRVVISKDTDFPIRSEIILNIAPFTPSPYSRKRPW
jgi:predicted nuclease of predicted toxin-antitoxin system